MAASRRRRLPKPAPSPPPPAFSQRTCQPESTGNGLMQSLQSAAAMRLRDAARRCQALVHSCGDKLASPWLHHVVVPVLRPASCLVPLRNSPGPPAPSIPSSALQLHFLWTAAVRQVALGEFNAGLEAPQVARPKAAACSPARLPAAPALPRRTPPPAAHRSCGAQSHRELPAAGRLLRLR